MGRNWLRLVRRFVPALAAAAIAAVGLSGVAAPAAAPASMRSYVVVLKPGTGDPGVVAHEQARLHRGTVEFTYRSAIEGFTIKIPDAAVDGLRHNPNVAWVQEDRPVYATAEYNPQFLRPEVARLDADRSSTRSGDGRGTVDINIAVLDSGIQPTVPDLNVVGGIGCVNNSDPLVDGDGHGTHVAGLIASVDNEIGIVGPAPGARLTSVQVLKKNGYGTLGTLICGIDAVTATRLDEDPANDIAVANMSVAAGGEDDGDCGRTMKDAAHLAICNSADAGVTYVAAASNDGADLAGVIPAAYDEVLTVTAMAAYDAIPGGLGQPTQGCRDQYAANKALPPDDDSAAFFSNYATLPSDQAHTVAAPGACTVSMAPPWLCATKNNPEPLECYSRNSGTSMASPIAAGVVALCIANDKCAGLSPRQIVAKIVADIADYTTQHPEYGFAGDPLHPIAGKYYGYLVRAGLY